ncbi:MAG: DNA-directed RNA polymerase subunit alpha [Acidobacteria bacterium]|nr:DNA-directed RNA polymerase subunit alpha [Acidobacteriota bacterium]
MEFLKGFQMPKRVVPVKEGASDFYGKFEAQPFERGFGTTIGHALRRTLLSSVEGAAITAVKITGVPHEFMTIPGVTEDVTDILLNMKQIPIRMAGNEPRTMHLSVKGEKIVTSGDILTDANIEILDNDVHIATLDKNVALEMEILVKKNRGYVPAELNQDEVGVEYIIMDSSHSPVKKVNYEILPARVGMRTDYDKLVLEVWTNGAITPEDALAYAAKLIKDQLSLFINFEEDEVELTYPEVEVENSTLAEKLNTTIEELELTVRAHNCLRNADIRTIGDLVDKTEPEVLKIKNFGKITLTELKKVLEEMGLTFGMDVKSILGN